MKKCLIIEDYEDQRVYVHRLLKRQEYSIEEIGLAADVPTARKLLENNEYALILLDIMLPRPDDGLELLEWLRNQGNRNQKTPVIVMTIRDDADAKRRARNFNIVGYLEKPFNEDDFRELVNEALK